MSFLMPAVPSQATFAAHTHPIAAPTVDANGLRSVNGAIVGNNCTALNCDAASLLASNTTVGDGYVTAIPAVTGAPS